MISSCTKQKSLGATSPVPILQKHRLCDLTRGYKLGFQQFRHRRAKHVFASGMLLGERVNGSRDPRGIETLVGLVSG